MAVGVGGGGAGGGPHLKIRMIYIYIYVYIICAYVRETRLCIRIVCTCRCSAKDVLSQDDAVWVKVGTLGSGVLCTGSSASRLSK